MKSKSKELYDIINEIDFFCDYLKYPKDISKDIVQKYSMQLGDEFERTFKVILSELYGFDNSYNLLTIRNDIYEVPEKLWIENHGYSIKDSFNLNKSFKIESFLKKYNFQKNKNYGITDYEEIKKCQQYLNDLLRRVDYSKFKPKNHIFNDIFIKYSYNNNPILRGEIDLIVDNKIIDIKTDNEIKRINKDYICQLLFYYSFMMLSTNLAKESNDKLSKIKIDKICIYYATFDYLLEFDLKGLIKKQKEFYEIIYNEFYLVNFKLKDVIKSAIFKKNVSIDYFSKIEIDINEKKIILLMAAIKNCNLQFLNGQNVSKVGISKYYESEHLSKIQFQNMLDYHLETI